jgi:putative hydrolases of HD superfamily
METDGLIDFIAEAGRLKKLPRTGWVESSVPDPESVADHSFRVALIAMILSDAQRLDTIKVVRMALLHDLAEAETGDLTPRQKETDIEGFKLAEDTAMVKLLEKLPEAIRGEYRAAWREFSEASTEEARLVRGADKLEMIMQASEYQQEMGDPGKLMRFRHVSVEGDLEKELVEEIKRRMG